VETAFITIPGHIFIAFALASSEEEVRRTFSHTDEFIFREGKAWVPVEVTEREGSFLAAWQAGAREWRENLANSQADFYPVREAWDTYEPVNYPGIGGQPPMPEAALVVKNFREDVRQIVTREISDRETELLSAAARSNNSPRALNALGILYARYDLLDKAEPQFLAAVRKGEYAPALVNLGNLRLRMKRAQEAIGFYERAARVAPHDPLVLLGLARSNHELQNYGLVKAEYDELKAKSPELAQRYAYLRLQGEEATRAREMTLADDAMLWEEEK
jgi:tetratricopeptide (TPR) repeat protein